MKFAIGMGRNETIFEIAEYSRLVERHGFSFVTFVDMPYLCRDVETMMTIAALNTERIRIGQSVVDPVTRHPLITANSTATIDELSGGRAFVGIGAGGPWGKAMRPTRLQEVREAVEFIRRFTAGEAAEYKGVTVRSEWIRRPLPVYVACSGPKACQLAGELADGVILTSAADPTVTGWRVEQVAKGARRAGRDPATIDVWARAMIYVTDSPDKVRREVAGYAVNGAYVLYELTRRNDPDTADLRARLEREQPGVIDECRRVYEAFDPTWVEHADAPAAKLVTDRIIETQHLVGTPGEIVAKLRRLESLGVSTFSTVAYTIVDKKAAIEAVGREIIPRFAA
jgi:5,10-methylenetetrahydromethanopterin reductase